MELDKSFKMCRNHDGYYINPDGVVIGRRGKPLKTFKTDKGYLRTSLGYGNTFKIHRLVAEAFIPNPDKKKEVNHKDGNKLNNNVSNLEWATHLENMQHAVRTGLHTFGFGEESRRAILNNEKVAYIRKNFIKRHSEFGLTGLGKKFGVTATSISRVVTNKNWN